MAPFKILPPHSDSYHPIQNPTTSFRSLPSHSKSYRHPKNDSRWVPAVEDEQAHQKCCSLEGEDAKDW